MVVALPHTVQPARQITGRNFTHSLFVTQRRENMQIILIEIEDQINCLSFFYDY